MKIEDVLTQAMTEAFEQWRHYRHALSSDRRDKATVSRSRDAAHFYGRMAAYAHSLALLWWGAEIEKAFVGAGPEYAVSHVLWVHFGDKVDSDYQTSRWLEQSRRFTEWLRHRDKVA